MPFRIDGAEVATVGKGETYTLGDTTYGYFDGANMYKAGTHVIVNSTLNLSSTYTKKNVVSDEEVM